MITRPPDYFRWEIGVRGFEFLKAHNVGLGLAEPVQQVAQAPIDVVDVETGDLHRLTQRRALDSGGRGDLPVETRPSERIAAISLSIAFGSQMGVAGVAAILLLFKYKYTIEMIIYLLPPLPPPHGAQRLSFSPPSEMVRWANLHYRGFRPEAATPSLS
jgi:hypothetical protein